MSRVLVRLSVAVAAAAAVGLAGVPATADPATAAATSAIYVVRTGGAVGGLVLQATPSAPDASFVAPTYTGDPALHAGWEVALNDVRGEAHVRTDGSTVGYAKTHFALHDEWNDVPFLRLTYVGLGVSCDPQNTWLSGTSGLSLYVRQGGTHRKVVIYFDQPMTLDPVHPGNVASPAPDDFRLTTATLGRVTTLADLAGYPQFAHYSATNGVQGYRLRIEQRETASSPPTVYDFLIGAVVCDL